MRVGVANQRIVMRTLDLPPLKGAKEISSAIRFQAPDHIPMPLEQAVLEHHSLGIVETPEGPRTRVVVVAARRDMIERLLEATRKAGLRPVGVDLSAFAMIRALYRPELTGATLYTSVGGLTNLAVAIGPTCAFTRVAGQGIESIAGELAERRALTLEHAHGWLRHVGSADAGGRDRRRAGHRAEAREVLNDGIRRIADEVRNSLDFLTMQDASAVVERVVLTGPAVAIPGFPERLGEEVGLPLEVGVVQEGQPGGFGGIDAGRLAVAAGLTLEEIPRMRAVNLIPAESRGRSTRVRRPACRCPCYVLLGFLAAAVALVTVYVLTSNSISLAHRPARRASRRRSRRSRRSPPASASSRSSPSSPRRASGPSSSIAAARFDWHTALVGPVQGGPGQHDASVDRAARSSPGPAPAAPAAAAARSVATSPRPRSS